jgi:hypothetical protein
MVFGAVNRTSAKADKYSNDLTRVEERTGQAQAGNGSGNRNLSEKNNQKEGALVKSGSGQFAPKGQSRGSGNGTGSGSGGAFYSEDPEDHDQAVLTGLVAEKYSESIMIEMDDASTIEIEGRTWRFVSESGFQLDEGDLVEMAGFFEDGEYKISTISNLTSDQTLLIRDETGRPYWSGGRSGK